MFKCLTQSINTTIDRCLLDQMSSMLCYIYIDYTNKFTDSEDKEKGRLSLLIRSKEQYVMVYILITRTSLQFRG